MNGNHTYLRETYKWGTFGKNGDEPLKCLILKEIHDDHLENILIMIRTHPRAFAPDILLVMAEEQEYRKKRKIRVPFKFG